MIISKKRWKINYDVGRVERPHKSLDPDSPLERKPLYYQNRSVFSTLVSRERNAVAIL